MDASLPLLTTEDRSAWIRLRTLILLRWLAVLGQSAAVLVASHGLGLRLPLEACLLVIGASAAFNAVAMALAAENRRLTVTEATLTLLFDMCQLGALLALTGGLGNPFALLIMAPVTVSASVLTLRATSFLAFAAAVIITLLLGVYVPLELADGVELAPPPVLAAGTWAALMTGTAFLAIYARQISEETFSMSRALAATQMALAREQQLSALGGVVAAAAHELGTPLATIKLASTELIEELADRPHLQEDAVLVRTQADRCTEILRAMGPRGTQDPMVRYAPLSSVVEEAAAPHAARGIRVLTSVRGAPIDHGPRDEPRIARQPEIIQGLRNLIQNGVDFARSTVWIDLDWTADDIIVVVGDDGPGYPPDLLGRIGDPFVRRRAPEPARPGYEGMGLGLFIAKTLLERSGAGLRFANGGDDAALAIPGDVDGMAAATGARVRVAWPRAKVAAGARAEPGPFAAGVPAQG